MQFHRSQRQRPRRGRGPRPTHSRTNTPRKPIAPPPRVYRDDELDMDVVEALFVDVRAVQTGTYPDGKPVIEYLNEKQAKNAGAHELWLEADTIDKGLKHQEETD